MKLTLTSAQRLLVSTEEHATITSTHLNVLALLDSLVSAVKRTLMIAILSHARTEEFATMRSLATLANVHLAIPVSLFMKDSKT